MQLDFEAQWFVIAVIAMVVVGLPMITMRVALPAQLKFDEVPAGNLTHAQAEFFERHDSKLRELGDQPFTTFRVSNLGGKNLSRAYASSSDPARILVTLTASPGGQISHNYIEIISRYRDGTILTTKNSNVSTVFEVMPERIVQAFRAIGEPAELKARHDAKAASLVTRGPVQRETKTFFEDFVEYHKRFLAFQQSRGLLRFDARAGLYRATVWTGLRGVRNFLNPLADNFTLPRFALGILFGSLVPLAVMYRLAVLLDWIRSRTGADTVTNEIALLGMAFAVGGGIVGYLFKQKSFIWAFVLGYLPIKLVLPGAHSRLVYCLWMAIVAESVSRWRMRREKLV